MNRNHIVAEIQQIRARAASLNASALRRDAQRLAFLQSEAQRRGLTRQAPVRNELAKAHRAVASYLKAENSRGKRSYETARREALRATRSRAGGCSSTVALALVASACLSVLVNRKRNH